ncbi:MAG TPA: protein-tyrosine-phosphatase [Saprospiraceae bacterium]|nr:protein-tyrosine-phosphatase [Saprospiraceae bacterium]HMQ84054.1 protein-tyrosine-phosphatase [Saprospiraceae bacterium]
MEKRSYSSHTNLLLPALEAYSNHLNFSELTSERKNLLRVLVDYLRLKTDQGEPIYLNFICTHNSRRSQFSQIWAQTAAFYYGIPAYCFSGGIEVTAFSEKAVAAILRAGFQVENPGGENPHYQVQYAENAPTLSCFSKLTTDPANPTSTFAAVMTCSHADQNCPFIPNAEQRIPIWYEDPKVFDNTPQEAEQYDGSCRLIATEFFYVFEQVRIKVKSF